MADLYRIVYTSCCAVQDSDEARVASIAAVLSTGRHRNSGTDITSVLALHRGRFTQVIEGSREATEAVFDRIRRDPRHHDVRVLERGAAPARSFPGRPLALAGHSPQGRACLDALIRAPGSDMATVEPTALVRALERVVAAEDAGHDGRGVARRPDPEMGQIERQALDAVLATAVFSSDRRLLRANGNFDALFAAAPGTLAGLHHAALVHGDDRVGLDALWDALARGRTLAVDHRGLRRDGADLWLRSTFRPRLDAGGQLLDVVAISTEQTESQVQHARGRGQVAAVDGSRAVVHFSTGGIVQHANAHFLDVVGYGLDDILGRHHRIFVDPQEAVGEDYDAFWTDLAQGRHRSGEYRRVGRDGTPVWLQSTFSPIVDMSGRVSKIIEHATVVTEAKVRQTDFQRQIAAIHRSHAVVTFDMGGIVLDANDNFLAAFGYDVEEVVGHHHRMFVDPAHAHSGDYARFWSELSRGRHQAGQFKRFGRAGREVWLQATYNPILDIGGRPVKVVKYASIVTDEKRRQAEYQGQIAAIHRAQCVVSFGLDGTILDANDNFLAATGYRLAEVRGRHHRLLVDDAEAASPNYAAFWAGLARGLYFKGEFRRVGRDGREVWLQATYNPIYDTEGRPFRIVKYAVDITAEMRGRADSEGQIDAIRKSQGLITFAMDGTITDVNDKALAMLGYGTADLLGRHHSLLVDPDHARSEDYRRFWDTLRSGAFQSGLYGRRGRDGGTVWVQATYNPILDHKGRPFKVIEIGSDVSHDVALAEAYEDAKRQAQHDAVTALPNRTRLTSFMAAALTPPGRRLAVLYLGLDRFRPIADAFGHEIGDRVLGEVADRLRRSLGVDQLAARVGGDEFVLVVPDVEEDAVDALCRRLIAAVSAPVPHGDRTFGLGLTIGVAVAPADGTTPDELLNCADLALDRARRNGGGIWCFHAAAMNDRILAQRGLVEDMRRGLATDAFFLEFQPRFEPRTRVMRSAEALVRWCHPERGRIGPGDFIPLAERSGLIVPLGEWVLRAACRAAAAWPGIGVSVNVSPVQFRTGSIVAVVAAALAAAGLDPHRLEIEITEGVLLENAERARTALDALKALGVRLAMDDFGTGYSSLSSLRSFPFDVIKIDRSFVADMDVRPGGRAVVQAILQLGQALGLSVTAEGVETPAQLAMLTADACQEVQGFLLARPMSAAAVSEWGRDTGGRETDAA